ncbi:exported protein of unknown function [Pseudodesulfovibrio profundus]|uniref:Ice-binding protein C-terminal domain-containing protein n=1 Tax=Pseudodesulfovibrio profundus TaxID=57320 RepID=A0A2C8F6J6_9BACT|nr:THxN family PEP-CTERM protein [Pseudodesulfovibrio profundus]SOB57998.1 exported protein of unknown function [Pseudodesulfovibrio profundus]
MITNVSKVFMILCLTILFSTPALAAQITQWEYSVSYEFNDYWNQDNTQTGLTPESYVNGAGETVNSLSWGDGDQSSIGFITKSGTVDTGTTVDIIDHMFHDNQPVTGNYSLHGAMMAANLTLKGIDPVTGAVNSFDTVLEFMFFETDNTHIFNPSRNNDVFLLVNPEASIEQFDYMGYNYTFSFTSGLGQLDMDSLAGMDHNGTTVLQTLEDLGYGDVTYDTFFIWAFENGWVDDPEYNLFGWTTVEGDTTYASSQLTVVSNGPIPTPEPSTFAIFGLGLVGLFFAGRRIRQ